MSILLEVTLISTGLSLLLVLLSKFLTNQGELKKLKNEMAELKKKIKDAQKEGNSGAAKNYTDQMFKTSQKQFKYSTKTMMVSMIVVLLAFSWLGARYGEVIVNLEKEQGVNQHETLIGFVGEEKMQVVFYDNTNMAIDLDRSSAFEDGEKYKVKDEVPYKGAYLKFGELVGNKTKAEIIAGKTPFSIPFVGNSLTWFWLYVFITIPTTFVFRKLLDVQ